ncbi:MAG: hypothetical protein ABR556_14235, partial [Pyrinomonadaceae bacterium]
PNYKRIPYWKVIDLPHIRRQSRRRAQPNYNESLIGRSETFRTSDGRAVRIFSQERGVSPALPGHEPFGCAI